MTQRRIGYFTRVLDQADPAERYRLATAQIVHAERCGYHSAWVAQHHFHEDEGGLPAPFVFLAGVAAQTTRIRLGTGIITLPLELPIRVAEDAAVFDLISGGRLEPGIGPGGNFSAFTAFGLEAGNRHALYEAHADLLRAAWRGEPLPGGDRLYPTRPDLADRIWQATFSVEGARRAGAAGDGLMLSRTQPRPKGQEGLTLAELQQPMVDAYLAALPPGRAPRIMASRSVYVSENRPEALRFAETGLRRFVDRIAESGRGQGLGTVEQAIAAFDVHIGTPHQVAESLSRDSTLDRATDLAVQVHSVDPPHPYILRSIEMFARDVAPAIGWGQDAPQRRVA